MAYETLGERITLPSTSDLAVGRMVAVNGTGYAAYTGSAGGKVIGVVVDATTGTQGRVNVIQTSGVARITVPGSSLAAGDWVAASSVGKPIVASGQNFIIGQVIAGSSGSTGRVLSMQISPQGRASS